MTPETKVAVRASVTVDGVTGVLLGGHGALSAMSGPGQYQLLLEQRISIDRIAALASFRGPVAALCISASPIAQNIVEIWIVDDSGKLAAPTSFDAVIMEAT